MLSFGGLLELMVWCNKQGSVLGPLLFAIFVNDLPDVVQSLMFLFADDTKLFHSIISDLDVVKPTLTVFSYLVKKTGYWILALATKCVWESGSWTVHLTAI